MEQVKTIAGIVVPRGDTCDQTILNLRDRQMRNFHLALMVSLGVPMIMMGDEYGHTKHGNNNTWCQDNELNWFQWNKLKEHSGFFNFYRKLIHFRKNNKILKRDQFLSTEDIIWHSTEPGKMDWSENDHLVVFTLLDHENQNHLYVGFNAKNKMEELLLPIAPEGKSWKWVVNTYRAPPNDIFDENTGPVASGKLQIQPFSGMLLKAY